MDAHERHLFFIQLAALLMAAVVAIYCGAPALRAGASERRGESGVSSFDPCASLDRLDACPRVITLSDAEGLHALGPDTYLERPWLEPVARTTPV